MSNILDRIIAQKEREVADLKKAAPVSMLEKSPFFGGEVHSLKEKLREIKEGGVIAEIKRKSPSRGDMNPSISVAGLSKGYIKAGAMALSILTDKEFFGGSNEDLKVARESNQCPILRKDFVVDEYQLIEAKSIGADLVLLIARILDASKLKSLATTAKSLGLEVLVEIHEQSELERACIDEVDLVGINNRDLDTLSVSVERSFELRNQIPSSFIAISESGISSAPVLKKLHEAGFSGFLIGEAFMQEPNPEAACEKLISDYRKLHSR